MGEPGKLNLGLIWGAATLNAAPLGGSPRTRVSRKLRFSWPVRRHAIQSTHLKSSSGESILNAGQDFCR